MGENFDRKIRQMVGGKDHRIVLGCLGLYAGVYGLYKLKQKLFPKPEVPKPKTAEVAVGPASQPKARGKGKTEDERFLQSFEPNNENLDAFFKWVEKPGNAEKALASLEDRYKKH